MVSESLRKSLTKQGYKIVGSHSGVKLCRWTKAMLRGRGGCYKHTFYGASSPPACWPQEGGGDCERSAAAVSSI